MFPQTKVLASGETKRWEVDIHAIAQKVPWASRDPQLLGEELREIAQFFPTFLVTVGDWRREGEAWGGSGKLRPCSACQGLLIFAQGDLVCADCGQSAQDVSRPLLGVVGRIPALLEGRPFHKTAKDRLAQLRLENPAYANTFASYFMKVEKRAFFAPPLYAYFPPNWRKNDPFVMVRPDYFDVLAIPPDHIYPGTTFRLCNYATWREVSLRIVLQQRIVPRIYIDLMVADLCAVNRLDEALDECGLSLHSLYNVIGKPEESNRFSEVYEQVIQHV